jgi:serine/threonine protein kinase
MGASFIPPQRAIITEFVDRGSLWDALRQDNSTLFTGRQETIFSPVGLHWPEWAIRRVLEGACMGLSYLHGHTPPILHRDLKSANLLLTESFQVKICDFGLARLRSLSSAMTAQVGTAQWMAPEVIAGGSYCESGMIVSHIIRKNQSDLCVSI